VALAVPALTASGTISRLRTQHQPPPRPAGHAIGRPKATPTPPTRKRTAWSASEAAYQKPQGQHAPALFARPRAALRV